ncbi:ABC-type branched-chain amino acid transport system, periplasmic component [Treponema sp. JC4]|uniref:ABC transporter substrate-binding protein n=1 Tax=Treponema sp. JC4 TaxID=1124982 RepID=UPI00025B0BDC|nr:ABC transporter substrate-binding protein [Treponema sp. JC4]EID85751.1 ABC-type branched-chain amino acid transport system, periplasmic component [Treponema sp. JC4]
MMKRNIKNILTLCAALSVLSLCLSCKSDKPALKREKVTTKLFNKEKIIRIACAGSWELNVGDNLQWEGIQLACDEINANGGVDGAQVELIQYDDQITEKTGLHAAYEISNRFDISAVIGHSVSGVAVETSKVYQYYGVLMFSPMATARKLTAQGFPYVFRNIPRATIFAHTATSFCKKQGWNRMIIYYLDTLYGEDISNAFEFSCVKDEIFVVDRESYSDLDLEAQFIHMTKWLNDNFEYDAVFLVGDMPQVKDVVKTMRENGLVKPILGGDTFDHPAMEEWIVENNVRDIYAVTSYDRDAQYSAYKNFKEKFTEKYKKEPDQQAVQGYDALKIITGAMAKAHSVKAKDVSDAIRKNTWDGLNGRYYFNKNGDIVGANIYIRDYNKLCDEYIEKLAEQEKAVEAESVKTGE